MNKETLTSDIFFTARKATIDVGHHLSLSKVTLIPPEKEEQETQGARLSVSGRVFLQPWARWPCRVGSWAPPPWGRPWRPSAPLPPRQLSPDCRLGTARPRGRVHARSPALQAQERKAQVSPSKLTTHEALFHFLKLCQQILNRVNQDLDFKTVFGNWFFKDLMILGEKYLSVSRIIEGELCFLFSRKIIFALNSCLLVLCAQGPTSARNVEKLFRW